MTYHKKLIEATKKQQKQHQDVIEGEKDKHKNPEHMETHQLSRSVSERELQSKAQKPAYKRDLLLTMISVTHPSNSSASPSPGQRKKVPRWLGNHEETKRVGYNRDQNCDPCLQVIYLKHLWNTLMRVKRWMGKTPNPLMSCWSTVGFWTAEIKMTQNLICLSLTINRPQVEKCPSRSSELFQMALVPQFEWTHIFQQAAVVPQHHSTVMGLQRAWQLLRLASQLYSSITWVSLLYMTARHTRIHPWPSIGENINTTNRQTYVSTLDTIKEAHVLLKLKGVDNKKGNRNLWFTCPALIPFEAEWVPDKPAPRGMQTVSMKNVSLQSMLHSHRSSGCRSSERYAQNACFRMRALKLKQKCFPGSGKLTNMSWRGKPQHCGLTAWHDCLLDNLSVTCIESLEKQS